MSLAEEAAAEKARRRATDTPFPTWLRTARTEEGPFPDWPFVWDYAEHLASGSDIVVLKRRQILISWITAAYFHWFASRHPGRHLAVISSGDRYAKKQGRRIVSVARADGYDVSGTERIEYPNGSDISIFPSTEHAAIGDTLHAAHLDEFADHPYAAEGLAAITPGLSGGHGQLIITSTTHVGIGRFGPFWEAWSGDSSARKVAYLRGVRPDQNDDWYEAESHKPGMTAAAMAAYYPRTAEEAWSSPSGLVYGEDSDGIAIFDKRLNLAPAPAAWAECKWRVASVDPGGRDPTAVLALGVTADERYHVYGLRYERGPVGAIPIHEYLSRLHERGSLHAVFVDPSQASLIATLAGMGWPACAAPNAKLDGIGHVASLLRERRLTVDPSLTAWTREVETYWWDERKDMATGGTALATKTPAEHHADAMDATRYAVMGVLFAMPSRRTSTGQVGRIGGVRWQQVGRRAS